MNPQSKYLIAISFLLNSLAIYGQSSPAANKLQDAAYNYYKRFPQEKLFIHTNQNAYTGSQALWYKVYAMAYGKPSQLSDIVYVTLTDMAGKQLIQNKRPLVKGHANGDLLLPDTLHTGWYQLQAYTAWMLNFKEDGIYQQRIYIKNLHDPADNDMPKITSVKYHIVFYPEGGDLVNGNNSNIAFKATNEYGQPAAISGELLVNNKSTGVKLVTIHDGMGSFKVDTYTTDKYTVNVRYPDNTTALYDLPLVKKVGTSLSASLIPDFISLNMFYAGQAKNEDVVITAMQSDGLSSAYPLKLNRGNNLVRFRKSDYSTGIIRFTIFDRAYIPLTERIVFINNNDRFDFSLNTDTLSFQGKAKNMFSLNITKHKKASISIAVTDADYDAVPNQSIVSGFLLTSEIKGYVNNPGYYFNNNSDTLQQHLDLVMLTNGWRHFKWNEILNDNPATLKYAPEKTQFVAGKIENYNPKKDLKVKFIIVDPKANKKFENVIPDSTGQFAIDDNTLNGTAKLYYNVTDGQNNKQAVKLKFTGSVIDSLPLTSDSISAGQYAQQVYSAAALDTLKREQRSMDFENDIVLKEVRIKAMRKRPIDAVINDHVKTLTPDRVFDIDLVNAASVPNMSLIQYIQGRFPGLEIYTSAEGKVVFRYRGVSTLMESSIETEGAINPPVFYLNESIIEYEDIKDISMYDLALVRYAPPPVWFAPLGGGISGAMMLYTKNYKDDNLAGADIKNFDLYNLKGYSISREFSAPDYTDPAQLKKHDYRSTLYWNPNATPDANGKFKVRFYNSDGAKHYRITMQGMDAEGRLGYFSKVIQ